MKTLIATVEAVCLSAPDVRVAKTPQDEAFLGPHGFVGDRHEAEFRESRDGAGHRLNHRQWSAVSTEEVTELCADLGVDPAFALGALGENLRLTGVKLDTIPEGSVLELPSGAKLLVSGRNDPCVNAAKELSETYGAHLGPHFVKQAFGRRGILGTVIETGVVRPGDKVTILLPDAVAST
ncbi:MAG TPA: MOSC domain-containing protein [Dehalococcoidia bacterium]|nr:MOSC domain-containing protein [Dehalococcoidia bacterium]